MRDCREAIRLNVLAWTAIIAFALLAMTFKSWPAQAQNNGVGDPQEEEPSARIPETPKPDWNPAYSEWFKRQKLNPETQARLNVTWTSCCEHADRIKVKFVALPGKDEWWYEDPTDGQWKQVPPDTIHEGFDPEMPEQLRVEGVLMVYQGKVTCTWIPKDGQ